VYRDLYVDPVVETLYDFLARYFKETKTDSVAYEKISLETKA